MTAATFLLALTGFAMLSLSMAKHHRDLFGQAPTRRSGTGLKCVGWLSCSASLALSILVTGVSIGIVQWFAFLTAAAIIVTLALAYRQIWRRA